MADSNSVSDALRAKYIDKIKRLKLLDDDFFRVCFQDDKEGAQFILRIILDKDDLTVIESRTQYSIKNLRGHSVILDVFATDSSGKHYDIEIQRADKGASPKRARYISSLIDANILNAADAYESLPECYVIFITENDVIGDGRLIYHIDRTIAESGQPFGDGSHIIYVNAACRDDSALGKLMQDFNCTVPGNMHYPALRQRTSYFKDDDKGVKQMCEIWEEIKAEGFVEGQAVGLAKGKAEGLAQGKAEGKAEGRAEGKAEGLAKGLAEGRAEERAKALAREKATKNAIRMIKRGNLTVEEIMEYTNLTEEEINELAELIAG